ncbi:MAG: hypothetical protein HOB40_10080 [Candidatus Marinimicrobia bacterium]|jgi:hypothetical protein|nr:hypothetical protein [Candidatus Neomarinimicrobiota bacterium]MBT3502506.1 hypothetical protein [Candidatus Neomarinimicrobiota bacterium]MBT3839197.1 hypothetical protein [Candidatus Neomarinimicrobiota bacterium]MBT4000446.1 hypothetical protein [Candidatus Neomarinimicrobiota bacterium]MBT4282796.1 hypothetical protein [Candidatus Neomarinimicrobiota bacterium]
MADIQNALESHLIVNIDQELADLVYNLGYDTNNEIEKWVLSGNVANRKAI